jgi:thiol-disulfide isomerase/thioredoxin
MIRAGCCPTFAMQTDKKGKHHFNPLRDAGRLVAIVIAAMILFSGAGRAADASDDLTTLRREVDGVSAIYKAYEKATKQDEQEKLWKTYMETNDALLPRVFEGVRKSPSSPLAFGLLEWVMTNGRISIPSLRPYASQSVELLRDRYTLETNISEVCKQLGLFGYAESQPTVEFLQIASEKNPDRRARGAATFALAWLTKRHAEGIAYEKAVPASIYTNAAARAAALDAVKEDSAAILQQAEQLFQTVITNYSDVANFLPGPGLREPKPTMGEQAVIELYECEHLTIGKIAPEIQGEDIDGHKLKLSDYRGKVVIISFWASWCGPCMQMVPHEKTIAQRLAGKPFVLIGVNGDSKKADAKRAMAEQKMTWQSFWNNGSSEGGIAEAWNVHGWPTVYILDATGMIRLKLDGYGGKRTDALLDAEVDQLVEQTKP